MIASNPAVHHFHKRIHQDSHQNPGRLKSIIDHSVYIGGFFVVLITMPQVLKIWNDKTAAGLSLTTWVGLLMGSLFWTLYGAVHREKPIIFINALTFILQLAIVLGILKYG